MNIPLQNEEDEINVVDKKKMSLRWPSPNQKSPDPFCRIGVMLTDVAYRTIFGLACKTSISFLPS